MQKLTQEQLIEAIQQESLKRDCSIIGVCGLGGSGKTTLCNQLLKIFVKRALHFEIDLFAKYATEERRRRISNAMKSADVSRIEIEENPQNWYDWEETRKALQRLKNGEDYRLENGWNQQTGQKDINILIEAPEGDHSIILADCIYLLHDDNRDLFDRIVYIDVPVEVTHERSQQRDKHRSDPEYRAYKEGLTWKYCVPYFDKYKKNADWVL